MESIVYIFSLIGYLSLSFLYFVQRDLNISLLVWLGLLSVGLFLKPFRAQVPLFLVIGLSFGFLNILHKISPWLQWPLDFYLASLFGFAIFRYLFPNRTEKLKWSFTFTRPEMFSIILINIPTIAVLIWYYGMHPVVANMWPVPNLPLWSIPIVVLAMAGINGLREEIFYRGLIQTNSSAQAPAWFVIGLQAILFGFLHFSDAFPQGWLGVFLTATWGAAIAIQYRIFKSISLAWITHAMADAIMFSIIIYTRS
jgi:membrane protease YdiL (CAAX protease family)